MKPIILIQGVSAETRDSLSKSIAGLLGDAVIIERVGKPQGPFAWFPWLLPGRAWRSVRGSTSSDTWAIVRRLIAALPADDASAVAVWTDVPSTESRKDQLDRLLSAMLVGDSMPATAVLWKDRSKVDYLLYFRSGSFRGLAHHLAQEVLGETDVVLMEEFFSRDVLVIWNGRDGDARGRVQEHVDRALRTWRRKSLVPCAPRVLLAVLDPTDFDSLAKTWPFCLDDIDRLVVESGGSAVRRRYSVANRAG